MKLRLNIETIALAVVLAAVAANCIAFVVRNRTAVDAAIAKEVR